MSNKKEMFLIIKLKNKSIEINNFFPRFALKYKTNHHCAKFAIMSL